MLFQSTLPRGERLLYRAAGRSWFSVSIHAPARGATAARLRREARKKVSIHAPARGATSVNQWGCSPRIRFNPRSREGSDLRGMDYRYPDIRVSIHAPARGATSSSCTSQSKFRVSIHAPARGATYADMTKVCFAGCFNPRSREGSD